MTQGPREFWIYFEVKIRVHFVDDLVNLEVIEPQESVGLI